MQEKMAMKVRAFGNIVVVAIAVTAFTTECSEHSAKVNPAPAHGTPTSLRPDSPPVKMKSEIKKDVGFSVRDATDLGRTVDLQHADLWRFCLERKGDAPDSVDLGAVPYGEECPDHWNAHVPDMKTPNITGKSFEKAYSSLLKKGYNSRFIDVYYGSTVELDQQDVARVHGQVCKQEPQAGRSFDASENVKLYVAIGNCHHK
ncbi:PASTA domain-containing protein [Streptomyces sp. NPDC006173]|uniref:PASTA domain-containing protein n=1 Tax=Streptomyces sp. NPDC006173 TaxID=3155349 RepID=UPI0033C883D2